MKKIKLFFTFVALLATAAVAFAQTKVSGKIVDNNGDPVIGAAVQLKGNNTVYAMTDAAGAYTISVPSDGTLVVSCLGYATQEIAVAGKSSVNVSLAPDSEMLNETVVVGYGSSRKVGNMVGAVTTVKSDVVKNAPSQSALDALQGQVAGMQVLSTGGVAGDNSISMKIHGVGSLTSSSEPLFIVDGVQSSSTMVMQMNPNDILSVTVLKDASSTSIYGSLGANGVVYVTTKSGNYDSKARITISSQAGISTHANKQFYENMMSGDELKDFWIRSGLMTMDMIDKSYTSQGFTYNTKWHNYFQNFNTPQYQNDITVEGGSKTVAYMLSASQFHQDGTSVGNFFDRYTLRSNIQARPTKWLKLGANVAGYYTMSQQNANWSDSSNLDANFTSGGLSFLINPLYPALDENGNEYPEMYPNGLTNPNYFMAKRQDHVKKAGVNGAAFVEITPIEGLTIASRLGTDSYVLKEDFRLLPSASFTDVTQRYIGTGFYQKHTLTNTIEYARSIKNHDFSVLIGHEGIKYNYSTVTSSAKGQTDDRLMNIQNGDPEQTNGNNSLQQYSFLSFFAHADYSYANRYFIDGTFRYDASSRFGTNNRWAPFWAIGAMWKISNEKFMNNASWINDLSLKFSYGTQGNANIGNYTHLGLVGGADSFYNENSALVLASPNNESLVWEKQKLLTVSLAGRFWDRFDFEFSFYNRATADMLMDIPQPYTTGFSSFAGNVGSMRNTGVDITLGVDILKGRDYGLNFHTTFNYNSEKVTELFDGRERWEIANTGVAFVLNQPVMYYYPIYAGVDPADGAPMWYLPGEDKDVCTMDPSKTTKVYNEDELTQNTGIRRHEPISGGFGLSGHWRGLSLNVDFAYFGGKYLINNDCYFYANPNAFAGDNQNKIVSDFWTPYNTDARYPDWSKGYKMESDTHMLENASFLRLKNLQLSYAFPSKWFATQNVVKGFRVSFTGRNLWTVTKYEGIDPEVDSNLTIGLPGNTLQVLGGIELTF